ncbi:MAG: DUF485 domain-containing protein [Candidatus Cloacimonadaceae bacterium]|nr:DUF485 domain-containing protein [Candidatus Cloacimonadaceae bacterium]MDP3113739.1 DUF485 domain-containing protein [Candidatus Cloacimonadaceae bacterium]
MKKHEPKQTREHAPVYDKLLHRKKRKYSFLMLLIFAVVYFFAAIIATAELKDIAAVDIMGLPLAFYVGTLVFVAGVIITRIYLVRSMKDWN